MAEGKHFFKYRLIYAFARSDQSSLGDLRITKNIQGLFNSDGCDLTDRMRRLIRVFARRTCHVVHLLTLRDMLGKTRSRRQFDILFSYLSEEIGFDISCKLSPKYKIGMNCQTLLS